MTVPGDPAGQTPGRRRSVLGARAVGAPAALLLTAVAVGAGCGILDDEPTPPPVPPVAGYVVPWDSRSAAALTRPPAGLHEVNPVWFRPTRSGGISYASDEARAAAEDLAEAPPGNGGDSVRLVPSVSNFRAGRWDGPLVANILGDPDRRSRHIDALADVARAPGVSGVDLDYESLAPEQREAYSAFVRDLAAQLHRLDRTLSVTVHARTDGSQGPPGAGAQDWAVLGRVADQVRVMAYDHSWEGSSPGPVAPLPWVRAVLARATREMPPGRVVLGVATYGYDWPEGRHAVDVTWAEAVTTARSRGVDVRWDERSSSPWFSYVDDGGRSHTVWYEDARALRAKLELARRYEVGGIVFWRLGGEDPATWELIPARDP